MKKNTKKANNNSKARFVLDTARDRNNAAYIMMLVSCKDARLKYPTGVKIIPKSWDPSNQRAVPGLIKSINKKLEMLADLVDSYFEINIRANKPVQKEELRRHLLSKEGKEERKKIVKGDFFIGIEQLIQSAEKKLILNDGKKFSDGTIRNWRKTAATLERFLPDMSFEGITLRTYEDFIAWAGTQRVKEKYEFYSKNYIGALIKDWKSLLELSNKKGYHKNLIHRDKEFKQIGEKPKKVDLNEEEIQLLKYVEGLTSTQEIIRDRFLINLYLGLRISDFEKLTENHIDLVEETIKVSVTQKTKSSSINDLDPEIIDIIKKYNGKLPRQYHRNVVNKEIKLICKLAGINAQIEWNETRGNADVVQKKEKWKMISNHTARRSAVTNYKRMGIDDFDISNTMGVSIKTLQAHYNLSTEDESLARIRKAKLLKKGEGENGEIIIPTKEEISGIINPYVKL